MNDSPTTNPLSLTFEEKKEAVREARKYGKVPIIYGPTKQMLKKPSDPGLSTFIENAMTKQEVNNLLKKGMLDYKNVSSKTIKKWNKVVQKRLSELNK